jgi:hypothetical protein
MVGSVFSRVKRPVVTLAVAFLLLGLIVGVRPASAQKARWTFMVYLDADNNLEDVGIDNFLLMAQVGSTQDVKIVVQFDRNSGYDTRYGDWSTTKRFNVTKGMTPDAANAEQDLGELNMADPATLSDFVKWAVSEYPADRYFLDIWNHGLGWQGVATDDVPAPNDHMTAVELGNALSDIRDFLGRPLDILANDACRMTLEIMYQASPFVDYIVGSEKDEPAAGWPYDTVLGALTADPSMGPVQFGSALVDRYVDRYRTGSRYSVTMALVNSSELPGVVTSLNGFVSAVNYSLPYFIDSVVQARNQSEHYEGNHCILPTDGEDYDLSDVAKNTQTMVESGRVISAADELRASVERAVIHEGHIDLSNAVNCVRAANATGLSLWYPWAMGSKQKTYEELALSRDSLWDEHLETYHNWTQQHVAFDASLALEDRNSDSRLDNARLLFQSSAAGMVIVDVNVEGLLHASQTYPVLAGVHYTRNISLAIPGVYDFFLYFRQSQGTINATSFRNVQVTLTLTFEGTIRDSFGNPIDGATVTVENMRTGQNVTTTSLLGHYSIDVVYPIWVRNGDTVRVEASEGARFSQLEFTLQYGGRGSYLADLYLPLVSDGQNYDTSLFGSYWFPVLMVVISLAIQIALWVLLVLGIGTKRRRTPPT